MSDVVILVPVLRRPHRPAPLMDSIRQATPEPHRVLFLAAPQDHAEHDAVLDAGGELLICVPPPGAEDAGYARKINAGVAATSEPLIFLGADDLTFHPGWLGAARRRLRGPIGVVGVNDLCSRRVRMGEHATHFLMTRDYARRPMVNGGPGPLCELYDHCFVDDELVATARMRGAIAFATDSVVEHLHHVNGKMPLDEIYVRGRERFREDRRLFRQRRRSRFAAA